MKTIWDILGSEAGFNGKVVASILQKLLQVEVGIGKILWIQWFAGGDQYFGKANVLSNAVVDVHWQSPLPPRQESRGQGRVRQLLKRSLCIQPFGLQQQVLTL